MRAIFHYILISFVFFSYGFTASLEKMSIAEKVGQLLMVHFHGEEANDDARNLIENYHVGGIIYYNWANGLHSPEQIQKLSSNLQTLAKNSSHAIPLFITLDQEGGVVTRLRNGFTIFPGNRALGMTGDPTLAELSAFYIGQELRSIGINMNLAPVVDINSNPKNPIIGVRSFGETATIVLPFARKSLEGFHRAGIMTSIKHYPGHGDVEVDSHVDLPILNKTKEELEREELLPFSELAQQADTVMTAHIMVPCFDANHCATLSQPILDYLRNEINFKGPIISDSLVMEGFLKCCGSIDEAAIQAFNAGCDILLLGGKQLVGTRANFELSVSDVQRIHASLVKAVSVGLISEERLNQAVQRILDLKDRYALSQTQALEFFDLATHKKLASKIASLALKKIVNRPIPSIRESKIAFFAPASMKEAIQESSLLTLGKETFPFFFEEKNDLQVMHHMTAKADLILFCSYNAWKSPEQTACIQSLLKDSKSFVLVVLRDPLDATLFPEADVILITYSPTAPSLQAAAEGL